MNQSRSLPVVGVTPDLATPEGAQPFPRFELKRAYTDAVLQAGGLPLVLPVVDSPAAIEALLARIDALVVSGGAFDVPAALYGMASGPGMGPTKPERTDFELALLRGALARGLPVLGICGGMQLLVAALGGTLVQDLPTERPGPLRHQMEGDRRAPWHQVEVQPGTRLARAVGSGSLGVNSTHHQGVASLGTLQASAQAPDGLVEAVELPGERFAVGVQWHPELMVETVPRQLGLYRALVEAAAER